MEKLNNNKTFSKKILDNNQKGKIESVKSIIITKVIFSFLFEDTKLKIIKYNKKYQKKFGIDIESYKELSGKYLIIDGKGIGRIYVLNTSYLIFEGKYMNGKKNGKGKEYYKYGTLKYEGEFLNDKKNGNGKEYNEDGNLIFKGRYFNGNKIEGKGYNNSGKKTFILEISGKGKEYYNNGKIKFEGEYLNGKKWNGIGYNYIGNKGFIIVNGDGYIKEYLDNGILKYKGEYLNGELNGKVKEYYNNGSILFEGEYINGKRMGKEKNIILICFGKKIEKGKNIVKMII